MYYRILILSQLVYNKIRSQRNSYIVIVNLVISSHSYYKDFRSDFFIGSMLYCMYATSSETESQRLIFIMTVDRY